MKHVLSVALLISSVAAYAADVPHPGQLDARIQTIAYDPDQVVLLRGTLGYQFMLEFASDERIETVSIGNSVDWQVTPNRKADVLFIKPIGHSGRTNLTVLTDQRRYAFELRQDDPKVGVPVLFIARMVYPQPAQAVQEKLPPPSDAPPVVVNNAYTITGSQAERPIRVFDDGHMTYFEWAKNGALPAIFAVAADGSESLVNYVVRGPYVVVEQVASRFMLRDGKEVAMVDNHAGELAASRKGFR